MDIIINRGKVVELQSLPPWSIALDGFVAGPKIDEENHRISFDHHANVLRFCTLSTCGQAMTAVLLGLPFLEKYTIYANDVDVDVCAAIWCLQNPDKCSDVRAKKLIDAINISDMHSGAIPTNGMSKTVEWVCEPETSSKRNQDYQKLSDEGLKAILESILHRIDLYVEGESSEEVAKQPKHGEYKILRDENDWALIESSDPHVYKKLYQAGFDRLVLVRPQENTNSYVVSLAKRSDFISNFPLLKLYEAFNKLEPGWGGSTSCGGSVRNPDGTGTHLSLQTIIEVIDGVVKESKL